jgi:hypothetical protein
VVSVLRTRNRADIKAYIHGASESLQTGPLEASHDVWSLGRLMLEMLEKGSMTHDLKMSDTLSFAKPERWSVEARDFLRNTSTASAKALIAVGHPM